MEKGLREYSNLEKSLLYLFAILFIYALAYILFTFETITYENTDEICTSLFKKYSEKFTYSELQLDFCRKHLYESFNNNTEFLKNSTRNRLTLPFMEYGLQICIRYTSLERFKLSFC